MGCGRTAQVAAAVAAAEPGHTLALWWPQVRDGRSPGAVGGRVRPRGGGSGGRDGARRAGAAGTAGARSARERREGGGCGEARATKRPESFDEGAGVGGRAKRPAPARPALFFGIRACDPPQLCAAFARRARMAEVSGRRGGGGVQATPRGLQRAGAPCRTCVTPRGAHASPCGPLPTPSSPLPAVGAVLRPQGAHWAVGDGLTPRAARWARCAAALRGCPGERQAAVVVPLAFAPVALPLALRRRRRRRRACCAHPAPRLPRLAEKRRGRGLCEAGQGRDPPER